MTAQSVLIEQLHNRLGRQVQVNPSHIVYRDEAGLIEARKGQYGILKGIGYTEGMFCSVLGTVVFEDGALLHIHGVDLYTNPPRSAGIQVGPYGDSFVPKG